MVTTAGDSALWTLTNQAKGVRLRAAPRLMMLAKVGSWSLSWCSLGPLTIVLGAKGIHLITIVSYTSVCSSVKRVSDTLLQNQLPLNSNESQVKSSLHRRFGHHKVKSWVGPWARWESIRSEGGWCLAPPNPGGPGWHCLVSLPSSEPLLYSALNKAPNANRASPRWDAQG